MSEQLTLATFRVAHLELALGVERVQEVLQRQDLTPVPLAPAAVEGLVNLRGQIVTAVAARAPLGIEGVAPAATALIVNAGEELLALLVDEVGDVVEVPGCDVAPVPETLAGPLADVATGVVHVDGSLVVVVDLDRVLGALR